MQRAIPISVILLFCCFSCNNEKKADAPETPESKIITKVAADTTPVNPPGSDRDEKGCIPSAGYRWSVVMGRCIRLFESGIKMLPKDPLLDSTTAAYLVFSADRVRVEIFLPTQAKAVIIRRTGNSGEPAQWASGPLELTLRDAVYTLTDEGKILYQGPPAN